MQAYKIHEDIIKEVQNFLAESLYELEAKQCIISNDIRISMPKRFIEAMQLYQLGMFGRPRFNDFPSKFKNVAVIENYKNEVAVFCVYFEKHELEFIKTLKLE